MRTFTQQINDNRIIMPIAPLPSSVCAIIVKTVRIIQENKLESTLSLTKNGLWAYITSSYRMNKDDEKELLETLSWMGFK